jgi:MFS transporter, DHA2 family, multidrug resistance protein
MVTAAALRPSCFPVSVPRRAEPFPVSSLPNVAVRGGEQHLAALNGSGSLDEPVSAAQPARAGLVLISLIAVAAVANLNLSVANVALPSIGRGIRLLTDNSGFDRGRLLARVGCIGPLSGRAGRPLRAQADAHSRYGAVRPGLPTCRLCPIRHRVVRRSCTRRYLRGHGISDNIGSDCSAVVGARTKSIALWSAIGGGTAALGPLVAGALLEKFWWGSVFLITLPLAGIALVMALIFVPSHVNETPDPVDNLGGVLSVVLVGTLILAINFAPVPNKGTLALGLAAIAVAAAIAFVIRQRRARNPLYDLHVAGRRIFWVAACAGIIVFGSLMGSAFVSQQYLQNVNGYSTLEAGAAFLPAVIFMVLVAPRSAKLVETRGARFTLLIGYVSLFIAFAWMLLFWSEGSPYWQVGVAYMLIGIGVGFAGTPASHSLTGSVPVQRAGMASGTADLQRDLGGAIMQSVFGALLTAGYASAVSATIAASPNADQVTTSVQSQLTKSFSSAAAIAERYPQYSTQIIAGAKSSFLAGADWAYTAGIIAIVVGAAIVFFLFPKREQELQLLATYHAEDTTRSTAARGQIKPAAGAGD